MIEQRITERKKCFYAAHAILDDGLDVVPCAVKDISIRGANLSIDALVTLPDEFDLDIPLRGEKYKVKMRWRSQDSVGVEFIPESTAEISELQRVIERNDKLEKMVARLTQRLAVLGHPLDLDLETL